MKLTRGVVDEDIDPSELSNDSIDDSLATLLLSDILRDGEADSTGLVDKSLRLLCVDLLLGQVNDRDVGSLESKHDGSGSSDPGVST